MASDAATGTNTAEQRILDVLYRNGGSMQARELSANLPDVKDADRREALLALTTRQVIRITGGRVVMVELPTAPSDATTDTAREGAARVAEIEARANAATKGPWRWSFSYDGLTNSGKSLPLGSYVFTEVPMDPYRGFVDEVKDVMRGKPRFVAEIHTLEGEYGSGGADGEFIAHAREDVPYLLTALRASDAARREAEAERDRLRAELERAQDLRAVLDQWEQAFKGGADKILAMATETLNGRKAIAAAKDVLEAVDHMQGHGRNAYSNLENDAFDKLRATLFPTPTAEAK